MDNNLKEAPIQQIKESPKEQMNNKIKKECQKILDKYFESRDYNKDKVELWKDYTLEEVSKYLEETYKDFGFVITIIIIKLGNMREYTRSMCRISTDDDIFVSVQTKTLYCLMRIYFYKIYNSNINLNKTIEEDTSLKMYNILTNKLEGQKYSFEFANNSADEIVKELKNYLLKKDNKPCSCNICSILQKPIDFIFSYKVIKFNYIPLIVSYSNDSLYSQLILLTLNN